ncbi:MAG: DUF3822 family protein [Bacteroidota bacterium]|nr:DUF3822 family protein [Bacteroidota bacterium]
MGETANNNHKPIRQLSILSTSDGFVFYHADAPASPVCQLTLEVPADFPDQFVDIVTKNGWAGIQALSVVVSDHSDRFTILPADITDPAEQRTFFNSLFLPDQPGELIVQPLSDGKQLFCCEIPSIRLNCYKQLFPNLQVYSQAFQLAEWAFKEAGNHQQTTFVACKSGRVLELFVANTSGILFSNRFLVKSISEATYFSLRCFEQLNLDPLTARTVVTGGKELAEALNQYIKLVEQAGFTGIPEQPLQLIS